MVSNRRGRGPALPDRPISDPRHDVMHGRIERYAGMLPARRMEHIVAGVAEPSVALCHASPRWRGPIRSLGEDELSNACANDRMVHRMYGMSMSLIPSVLRGCTSVPAGHESIPSVRGRRRAPAGDVPAAGRASRNLLRGRADPSEGLPSPVKADVPLHAKDANEAGTQGFFIAGKGADVVLKALRDIGFAILKDQDAHAGALALNATLHGCLHSLCRAGSLL